MVLRASFGTYMIHQYRTGAHFRGLNEQEFFDRLAAMMNTSSDMLANVYGLAISTITDRRRTK